MALGKLQQALTAHEVFRLVSDDLKRVEQEISLESMASVDAITAVGQYLQGNGGKRLRPVLVLLTCKLVGEVNDSAIRMAAVVEMLHTATLVHDDVIDTSMTRRGKPSANAVWGNQTAVLAGDWLYMQAFQMALRERNFRMLDLLISLTQMMVEGELIQLERIGHMDIAESDYLDLVDRKTASLFAACARLGAICGDGGHGAEQRLGEYAWNLGMAFQVIDDILDFTADERTLGKPVGNDLREGKVTLPLLYALEDASRADRQTIEQVLEDHGYLRVPFAEVRALVDRYYGIVRARDRAQIFTDRARLILQEFPESAYQRALMGIIEIVADRDR